MPTSPAGDCSAILLCGGSGRRMEGAVADKILAPLGPATVFQHGLRAFRQAGFFNRIVVVDRDDTQREALQGQAREEWQREEASEAPSLLWARGGAQRQDSVMAGLEALGTVADGCVFIHDAARPLLRTAWLQQLREAVEKNGAACLGRWAVDTIKRVAEPGKAGQAHLLEDLDRNRLWVMETPQVFLLHTIREAYRRVRSEGCTVTDDAGAAALLGQSIALVQADGVNLKVTRPEDLQLAEYWLQ